MPPRHRPDLTELMDSTAVHPAELRRNLRDLRRYNAVFRWRSTTRRAALRLIAQTPGRLRLLDVATGSGDIPMAIAGGLSRSVELWGCDLSQVMLDVASEGDDQAQIRLVKADARLLPFADSAFDIAMFNLALHHFPPAEAVCVLSELGRVGRRVLVTDLERSWLPFFASKFSPLVSHNRLTRHDGPVSVLRAYTIAEVTALAREAGLQDAVARRVFPARIVLTAYGVGAAR